MVHMQVSLEDLGPLHEHLQNQQERNEAEAVICPPHPNPSYADIRLRVGQDKRGIWYTFEPIRGMKGPEAWRLHKPCSNTLMSKVLVLDTRGLLEFHRGPGGCHLLYLVGD